MTKKYKNLYDNYKMAMVKGYTELYQVYGRFSSEMIRALDRCKEIQYRLDGTNGVIVSASCHFFTYAFTYVKDGAKRLMYFTGRNTYDFQIEE